MDPVGINEAQTRLDELVKSLGTGDEIVITRDDQPVARLVPPNGRPSLLDIVPASVGAVLAPLTAEDDLLDEMSA